MSENTEIIRTVQVATTHQLVELLRECKMAINSVTLDYDDIQALTSRIDDALKEHDTTIQVHIHLSEDEIRRLLLPHVASAFASELDRRSPRWEIKSGSTSAYGRIGGHDQTPTD